MTKKHDAAKLERLRDELTSKLGSTRSTGDASRDAREESRAHLAEAVRLSGIRGFDVTQHPEQLVARLELDAAALQGDVRQAATLRAIEKGLVAARAALVARATSDRLAAQSARLNKEASDLGALVRACDKWLEQPEGV